MHQKAPNRERRSAILKITLVAVLSLSLTLGGRSRALASNLKFEISFPASAHAEPVTGRVFVVITRKSSPEPRLQAGFWGDAPPLFGLDVDHLKPGEATAMDAPTLGYPLGSLKEIPSGDYYVQAMLNVYTEFRRTDGHTIWAHMDQWEGQKFNESPGNLISKVLKLH